MHSCQRQQEEKNLKKNKFRKKKQQQNVASAELNVDLFELTQNELFLIKLDI